MIKEGKKDVTSIGGFHVKIARLLQTLPPSSTRNFVLLHLQTSSKLLPEDKGEIITIMIRMEEEDIFIGSDMMFIYIYIFFISK